MESICIFTRDKMLHTSRWPFLFDGKIEETDLPLSRVLTKALLGTSLLNAILAAINLVTVVVLVRWFGASAYAHYIVDLASLGLILIVLEAVPSNYSLFRVQDDPGWQRCVAAQIVVTVVVATGLVFLLGNSIDGIFQSYSNWMVLYVATVVAKRYLDIRLQSSGRLAQYMETELFSSIIRLMLLGVGYLTSADGNLTIWASLAIAALISQLIWWIRNSTEIAAFRGCLEPLVWRQLYANFPAYRPYYLGIVLKRLRDNLVPLAAEWLFASRELLAAFLLAYRGILFAVGQIRIVESLLNHRAALAHVENFTLLRRCLIALGAQILCLIVSAALLLLSTISNLPWAPTIALSFTIWPLVFYTLERAKAYSTFKPGLVNFSIISYLVVVGGGALVLKYLDATTLTMFALVLLAGEAASYMAIKAISGARKC